jgi:FkbM family methyltransferase
MWYAENNLDEFIRNNYYKDTSYKGTFVDVGIGPTLFKSNSKHFRDTGWRVVGIDPNPKFVLQHMYAGNEIYAVACSDTNSLSNFTVNYNNDSSYSKDVDGVSFSAIDIKLPGLPKHNIQYRFNTMVLTLDTVLEYADISKVDILSIDVEGWELSVMRGFNHKKYVPKIIIIENLEHKSEYTDYMAGIQYKFVVRLSDNYIFEKI